MSSPAPALPRVLLLTPYFHPVVGGVETHARDLAAHVRARGGQVTILTKRLGTAPDTETLDGVPVRRVGPTGAPSPAAKWLMIPGTLLALARLRSAYDVIYCPDARGVGLAAAAMGRLAGRPVVLEAAAPGTLSCASWDIAFSRRGIDPEGRLARLVKWFPRRIYRSASAIACLSSEIEAEARAIGVPVERITRVRHGVDLTRFRPAAPGERAALRQRLGLPTDIRLCVYLGRLSREKGVIDLLEAWRQLLPGGARLLLVGPGTPGHPLDVSEEARQFVARHGLAAHVTFFGPSDEPADLLRAADLFVLASRYEAFGIAAAEALATGLPVLATRIPGLADYLDHGRNALLAAPGAPSELSAQLKRLLDDEALRDDLGRAARATAESLFDAEQALESMLDLIRRATERAAA
jgi:glycosyltransferase involved in cell wall biosynthesis